MYDKNEVDDGAAEQLEAIEADVADVALEAIEADVADVALEAIEKLGIELLGVRGYDERGRALHDLPLAARRDPEGPEPRAWLYNAMRAAHGLPAGKMIARADFAALVEATANIRIG